jgi:hypothetical protein
MDQAGLITRVVLSAADIDAGRKGHSTDGREHEWRLAYEKWIAAARAVFSEVVSTADPQTILLAEEAFVEQELQFCGGRDTYTCGSLTQAVQSFDDAFLCIEAVEGSGYMEADKTWPHSPKYRIQGFPKDAFHLACIAHRTRLQNVLRSPGINMIEKAVLEQRAANMTAAQGYYVQKQKKAIPSS